MAGAMSGDFALGSEIAQGIRDRQNGDVVDQADKVAKEKNKSSYSHSPETESALRNMETEKLVKVLAARPDLITPDEWQSSPELYDLYQKTRRQMGLQTNVGNIKTDVKPPEPREKMRDFREPIPQNSIFGGAGTDDTSGSRYDKFLRPQPNENETVEQQRNKQLEFDQKLNAALFGVRQKLVTQASAPNNDYQDPVTGAIIKGNNLDETMYTPAQLKKVQAQREEAKTLLQVFSDPKAQDIMRSNPMLIGLATEDPKAAARQIAIQMGVITPDETGQALDKSEIAMQPTAARKDEAGVAPVISPNPLQSSVGGGNEYGGANQVPIENDEMASLREISKKYPVQAEPSAARSVANTPSKPSTYTMDPLTKKAYAPVSQDTSTGGGGMFSRLFNNKYDQSRLDNYQSDASIQRSGEGGTESATDFIRNAPIYQKRLADQAPAEARGGSIRDGGNPHDSKCHVGIIHMAVGGRTDHLPMNVYANSYVIPADVVSGLGEGNTLAGGKVLDHMFSGDSLQKIVKKTVKDPMKRADGGETAPQKKQPWDTIVMPPTNLSFGGIDYEGGPFGSKLPSIRGSSSNFGPSPYQYRWQPKKSINEQTTTAASGGMISDRQMKPVEIIAAGGEYVIPPEVVRSLGHGDAESGHKWLDNFVKSTRAHTIKTMQKLPGPKKD
jgi:hypothetical protein